MTEEEKHRARQMVNNRVRDGQLPRVSSLFCIDCGKPAQQYDHARGYANPLDVEPVCRKCHGRRTSFRGEIASGDRNGFKTHPENVVKGERHWTRTNPEKVLRGEHHRQAVLTADKVILLRNLRDIGFSISELAAMYSIGKNTAWCVISRKTWAHV